MSGYFKFCIFLITTFLFCVSSEVIEIKDGKLNGTVMISRKGVKIHSFLKIPYAEPPNGSLRFQPPVRNKPWEGILDATKFGPQCMQYGSNWMSEDCLHLNVFSKNISSMELMPVIVYIHGGGYTTGSSVAMYPDYLLDRDIVLVTINYRLGPFGFMAIGTKDAPGNAGLKDQVMALKWVQRNIMTFGGDPNLVTIAGCSAGGFSVTSHLASKMSYGLFKRAIAMSGAITYQTGLEYDNLDKTMELAKKVNCSIDLKDIIGCLQSKKAQDVLVAGLSYYYGCLDMPWFPVVEKNFSQEMFFAEQPNNLFKTGRFNRVPVITGITADEFISPVVPLLSNPETVSLLNNNFTEIASKCFFFKANAGKSTDQIAKTLRKHYLPYEKIDITSFNSLQHLCADGSIGYSVHKFVHYTSNFTDVYYYKFTYLGSYSSFLYPRNKAFGVHHGDDRQYVLFTGYPPKIRETDPDNFMVERMTRIWEQFARTGNPQKKIDTFLTDMVWPKHNHQNEYYLDIGREMVEKQGLYLERYNVWDNLEANITLAFEKYLNILRLRSVHEIVDKILE